MQFSAFFYFMEVMPMLKIPARDISHIYFISVATLAKFGSDSVVHSSIDFCTDSGYCVCCKTEGLSWNEW